MVGRASRRAAFSPTCGSAELRSTAAGWRDAKSFAQIKAHPTDPRVAGRFRKGRRKQVAFSGTDQPNLDLEKSRDHIALTWIQWREVLNIVRQIGQPGLRTRGPRIPPRKESKSGSRRFRL